MMIRQDFLQKFMLETSNVRGVLTHIDQAYQTILKQHAYPQAVKKHLGEVLLSAVMLMSSVKSVERMTIQFQSDGAVKMLVAQVNDQGHLRGLAQWQVDATHAELEKGLGDGQLVVTAFLSGRDQPMQSIVPLQGNCVADAFGFYFLQSEQLPTKFYFSVTENQAAGCLLQMIPQSAEKQDPTLWQMMLSDMGDFQFDLLQNEEAKVFLKAQFSHEEIRLFEPSSLEFKCGCTVEKMAGAIRVMGQKEANLLLKDKSEIVVMCEYCNHQYGFDRAAVDMLFNNS